MRLFIEGAREGFTTAVKIIPYLVAILVAIGMFRASGAMDVITSGLTAAVDALGMDSDWVAALPTAAIMKPLSGSGSRGMMVDLMNTYGPDAFVSRRARPFREALTRCFTFWLCTSVRWG